MGHGLSNLRCCCYSAWAKGQVIDTEVLGTVLGVKPREEQTHPPTSSLIGMRNTKDYHVNHYGSSNAMEADGAVVMWQRSIEKHKLRYTSVIADGDAKTYKAICDTKPYGPDVEIVKHECVAHAEEDDEPFEGPEAVQPCG